MKQRLFVDMDGTLAVWENSPIEVVARPGYFLNRSPVETVIAALKELMKEPSYACIIIGILQPARFKGNKNKIEAITLHRIPPMRTKGRYFCIWIAELRANLTRSGKEGNTIPTGPDLKLQALFSCLKTKRR